MDQPGAQYGNQGEAMMNQSNLLTKDVAREIRMGFVRKVYSILTVQLLVTVLVAWPIYSYGEIWIYDNQWLIFLCSFLTVALMCVMVCCKQVMRTFPQNYILLFLFTAMEGVLIGVIVASYTVQSVLFSVAATVLIFGTMTLYACCTKTDFTGMGPYIFAFLMVLSMFSLIFFMFCLFGLCSRTLIMVYNFIGVLLFTFYIVYDTQLIVGEWGGHKHQFQIDDYIFAALSLYLDIINLFLYILAIFGNRR